MQTNFSNLLSDTKKNFKQFVRGKILAFDGKDPFWFWLITLHPEFEEKSGVGIKEFFITANPFKKSVKQVNIRRVDGSEIDFSWLTCVDQKNKSNISNLSQAMRGAVVDQIIEFSSPRKHFACELCGDKTSKKHVDHEGPTFFKLVSDFISFNLTPEKFDDCETYHRAKFKKEDDSFEKKWKEYHRDNARLRILCERCNLTRKKK